MKKRFLMAAAITCMLVAGFVTGCGSKTADAPTTAATEAAADETSAETSDAAADETSAEAASDAAADSSYIAWSGKEWNAADDTEKAAAAKAYLIETTKVAAKAAGQEYTSEMEASITDENVSLVIDSLEAGFAADESITIQEMLDAATEVMDTMMEAAEENQAVLSEESESAAE